MRRNLKLPILETSLAHNTSRSEDGFKDVQKNMQVWNSMHFEVEL